MPQISRLGKKRLESYYLINSKKRGPPVFKPNDVFYSIVGVNKIDKRGKIDYLRDDKWEQQNAYQNHYSVTFDDGTFETYQSESTMVHINEVS